MVPEEQTSYTPQVTGAKPPLTRAEVAIGSLSRQLSSRPVSETVAQSTVEAVTSLPIPPQPGVPTAQSVLPLPQTPVSSTTNQAPASQEIATQPISVSPEPIPVVPYPPLPNAIAPIPQSTPQVTFPSQPLQQIVQNTIGQKPKKKASFGRIALTKRALLTSVTLLALVVGAGGLYVFAQWYAAQNTPEKIFSDAMQNSLQTSQVDTQTKTNGIVNTADFDLSSLSDPIVSTHQTVDMYGSNFVLQGYGSAQNTYVSYSHFPATVSPAIKSLATNGWIQLRTKGVLPGDVDAPLVEVSDPRYQTVGILTFGIFGQKTSRELINYANSEKIYAYNPSTVQHTIISGTKVLAYRVNLNVPFLKIFDESAATDEGFSPTDVQAAVDNLSQWTGAKTTLYVSTATHRFVEAELSRSGQNTTIVYSNYDNANANLPNEPETRLNWTEFENVQSMISAEAVAKPVIAKTASVVKPVVSTVSNKL